MKLAIVGSRDFPSRGQVIEWVTAYLEQHPDAEIVSGGAPGVDSWAVEAAVALGAKRKVFPADWNHYGRSAGFRRNHDIVGYADAVVAFWDGKSRGTQHSMNLAKEQGKTVTVISPNAVQLEVLDAQGL